MSILKILFCIHVAEYYVWSVLILCFVMKKKVQLLLGWKFRYLVWWQNTGTDISTRRKCL